MSTPKYTSSILITGGTQGLGYHAALALASKLPNTLIVLASRSDSLSSASQINTQLKQSNVIYTPLDLSSLATVRAFAQTWLAANHPPISALLLNAGLQFPGDLQFTPDGIESHFGINHVGHALLFHLLVPCLAPDARILVVSSGVHDIEQAKKWGFKPAYTTGDRVAKPEGTDATEFKGRDRYATSKAANAIWTYALARHLRPAQQEYTVLAFDPGLMFGTQLVRDAGWALQFLNRWLLPRLTGLLRLVLDENINTPTEAGGKLAWLASSDEVKGRKGVYFETRKERDPSVQARDEGVQEELWKWTIQRVKESEDEGRRFEKVE
jgi:NAD(P)-dependent dehydrogenase (short-subunit alcohol dehydrogenase family)